jgi:nicotinamidase/pyrazinamidase
MTLVFVSHQQRDLDFAELVAAKLREAGFEPWLAVHSLSPGMRWKQEIDDAIENSIAMVVVMSAAAQKSEYVTYEWAYAMGRKKPVLCLKLMRKPAHPKLEDLQHSDFTNSKNRQWDPLFLALRRFRDASNGGLPVNGMRHIPSEVQSIAPTRPAQAASPLGPRPDTCSQTSGFRSGDVLVVVDVQSDFCQDGVLEVAGAESLIEPLNRVIAAADRSNMQIVFTRDWHPNNHSSFKPGGRWPPHCIQESQGAKFHPRLKQPAGTYVVDIGVEATRPGYSPYEQSAMDEVINRPDVDTVYVTGIALEYCVRATCMDTIDRQKKVVALEPYILAASDDPNERERIWRGLERAGVGRWQEAPFMAQAASWPEFTDGLADFERQRRRPRAAKNTKRRQPARIVKSGKSAKIRKYQRPRAPR